MVVRNPSEWARLEEELEVLHADLKNHWPKAHKESILRQIRQIEGILGLEGKSYNSNF